MRGREGEGEVETKKEGEGKERSILLPKFLLCNLNQETE